MTGTTTQIMIDLADTIYAKSADSQLRSRMAKMTKSVIIFAIGCGAAALLYSRYGVWSFVVPPGLGAVSLLLRLTSPRTETKT
jgi:uncharacterized membrane protein YoaK (UPF0700 family)